MKNRPRAACYPAVMLCVLVSFCARAEDIFDLAGYSVAKLDAGINRLNFTFAGRSLVVVIGHRENNNAHSFDVVTVYLERRDPKEPLELVGFWRGDQESETLSVAGGADCLLQDFRLLAPPRGRPPVVIVAHRAGLGTFVDNEPVTFEYFVLRQQDERRPGPNWSFERIGQRTSRAAYCDVDRALEHELRLADYRVHRREPGYRSSPGAVAAPPPRQQP